jgi:hypothetical protein
MMNKFELLRRMTRLITRIDAEHPTPGGALHESSLLLKDSISLVETAVCKRRITAAGWVWWTESSSDECAMIWLAGDPNNTTREFKIWSEAAAWAEKQPDIKLDY